MERFLGLFSPVSIHWMAVLFDLGVGCKVAALQWPNTLVRLECALPCVCVLTVQGFINGGKQSECSSSLSPHSLLYISVFLRLSPISFVPLPFALPHIVLAISRSTNGSFSSISGEDPGPAGERGWRPSEYREAFLSRSLFILSPWCFHSLAPPLYPSPPLSVCVLGDCAEDWVHVEGPCAASLCL